MRLGKTLVLLALTATALVPTRPAAGAFPGTNGWVAFTGQTTNGTGICVLKMGEPGPGIRLVDTAGPQSQPAWSADGSKIAYVDGPFDEPIIEIYDLQSGTITVIGPGESPAWSPDGSQIVFWAPGGIHVADVDGTDRSQIVSGGYDPVWSPDGNTIAFADDLRNEIADDGGIFLVDPDGSNERELPGGGEYPDWSPDGTRLVMNNGYWAGALYVTDVATGEQQQLIQGNAAGGPLFYDPVWSPNGRRIAFTRLTIDAGTNHIERDIWMTGSDGADPRPLRATRFSESQPDWQPLQGPAPDLVGGTPCRPYVHRRTITLELSGHLIATGRVRSRDGDLPERIRERCERNVQVRIQRRTDSGTRIYDGTTDARGRFSIRLRDDVPGVYRAVAVAGPGECSGARSERVAHRH